MIEFIPKHPGVTDDHLGFIPLFLWESDERPAREQFHDRYAHGGGWRPFEGFEVLRGGEAIQYPGDPELPLLAEGRLRDEVIRFYNMSWVSITGPDGSVEIARMD